MALGLLVENQPLQLRTGAFQQQGEAFIEAALAILWRCDAVEAHQGMQPQAGQGFTPVGLALGGAADEVEHRQQRFAATGEHRQLVAVFGQNRFAGIDHIQPGIRRQQLAQHLGLLFEALSGFAAGQEAGHPRRTVQALTGAVQAFEIVEQGDGIFQAGRVVQLQQGIAVHRQARTLYMAGGAGTMGDLAESHVAGQGAQQRGLADIGVADHGQFQRLSHGRSPTR